MFSRSVKSKQDVDRACKDVDIDFDGSEYVLTIKKHRKNRSLDQNALYWKWLHEISRHNGDSPQYLHEWYRAQFLAEEVISGSGGTIQRIPSTTDLNTKVMAEYMDNVRRHASEFFGIYLPCPDDQGYPEMMAR